MWATLVAGCCLYLWAFIPVRCSNRSLSQCRPVAMLDDLTLSCDQETSSSERFILWYYSKSSESGYESAASCYFDNVCNVTDHAQYVIEDRSQGTLARSTLTIKNVSAGHNGWAYQCYVWDALEDILYLTEEYRLLVYKAPRELMKCSNSISKVAGAVNVKCQLEGVFPHNIFCRLQCQSGARLNLNVRDHSSEFMYKVVCEGSIRATSQSDLCNITVLAQSDAGTCEYVLATSSDPVTFPSLANSDRSFLQQDGYVPQGETNTNVYFSYIFSGVVAALVIPLSICTLFLVLRKRRRESIASLRFPVYEQANTSQELVSANSTNWSWQSSWESGGSCSGEVASGVYNNPASMCGGDAKSNQCCPDDAPVTLPFLTEGGDAADGVSSGEFSEFTPEFAPLPIPHKHQQTVTVNRHLKEHQYRCHKPRSLTEMTKRKRPYGIETYGSTCEYSKGKKLSGDADVCNSCKRVDTIIPNSGTSSCVHFSSRDALRRVEGDGSKGCNLRHLYEISDRSQENLSRSGTNSGVGEGGSSPQAEYVCNRSFCGTRREPRAPCRGCRRSDPNTECENREDRHRRPYLQRDDDHQRGDRCHACDEEIGHGRRNDCTERPYRCDCHQQSDNNRPELYIDPCSSGANSATSSSRQASTHSSDGSCEDDEQITLLEQTTAPEDKNL